MDDQVYGPDCDPESLCKNRKLYLSVRINQVNPIINAVKGGTQSAKAGGPVHISDTASPEDVSE